jgi:hypothetical protein
MEERGQIPEGKRVLHDEHGLMVFESEPPPLHTTGYFPIGHINASAERFTELFNRVIEHPPFLSEKEHLALELYFSSFFQRPYPDTSGSRFLLLMMAVEALIEPEQRPPAAVKHVEQLIHLTKEATSLSDSERESLLGSLHWLRKQSISRAGRALAAERLGEATYDGMSAPDFFRHCYNLRSRLVHGETPAPTVDETGSAAATLELFVRDLLSTDVIE